VYVIAAALVIVAGIFAVRLARPDDPYESVRVERVSEGASRPGARTERVQWDSERGRGVFDVREGDGVVRRYYMESDGADGMRVWGGEEVQPEEDSTER
jgi:hypothetical protein